MLTLPFVDPSHHGNKDTLNTARPIKLHVYVNHIFSKNNVKCNSNFCSQLSLKNFN
jgi:hypothetical protein